MRPWIVWPPQGPAVAALGSLARDAGTPVNLHGPGGAWMVVSDNIDESAAEELYSAPWIGKSATR